MISAVYQTKRHVKTFVIKTFEATRPVSKFYFKREKMSATEQYIRILVRPPVMILEYSKPSQTRLDINRCCEKLYRLKGNVKETLIN